MDERSFILRARMLVLEYIGRKDVRIEEIPVMWQCGIMQNLQAVLAWKDRYYEVVYDGDRDVFRLSVYRIQDSLAYPGGE